MIGVHVRPVPCDPLNGRASSWRKNLVLGCPGFGGHGFAPLPPSLTKTTSSKWPDFEEASTKLRDFVENTSTKLPGFEEAYSSRAIAKKNL